MDPEPRTARRGTRPGVCTVEVEPLLHESGSTAPASLRKHTSRHATLSPGSVPHPLGLDTQFPGSKAPMRSMMGRLLSEDSEPAHGHPTEYPPFFSTAGEELEKSGRVQRSGRPPSPPDRGGPLRESKAGLHVQTRNGEGSKAPWLGGSGLSPILDDHGCD